MACVERQSGGARGEGLSRVTGWLCAFIERRELSAFAFSAFQSSFGRVDLEARAVHWPCYGAVTVRVATHNASAPFPGSWTGYVDCQRKVQANEFCEDLPFVLPWLLCTDKLTNQTISICLFFLWRNCNYSVLKAQIIRQRGCTGGWGFPGWKVNPCWAFLLNVNWISSVEALQSYRDILFNQNINETC